eukprot:Nk52_evm9s598 gene=Nk52_evmTU9s598
MGGENCRKGISKFESGADLEVGEYGSALVKLDFVKDEKRDFSFSRDLNQKEWGKQISSEEIRIMKDCLENSVVQQVTTNGSQGIIPAFESEELFEYLIQHPAETLDNRTSDIQALSLSQSPSKFIKCEYTVEGICVKSLRLVFFSKDLR